MSLYIYADLKGTVKSILLNLTTNSTTERTPN